jgi:hypothetical protein
MEFAAALIATYPERPRRDEHLRNAVAGADEDSLLARNLTAHFNDLGPMLGALKPGR